VHAAPSDLRVHRRVFGTNVEFGSEFNGFVCAATDLDRVNPSADPVLATYALQFVETLPNSERESTTHEVRKAAYILLPLGSLSIERVARSIGLNVRTLQRRLAVEGAEFSSLVDGVRRDLALRYMENPNYSVTRISELLGYGQLSSFTRWFSAAFGVPPASWRDNHQPKNLHESRRPKR
jgi:AraC-like DNA-binding protein